MRLISILIVLLLIAACGTVDQERRSSDPAVAPQAKATEVTKKSTPIPAVTVTDERQSDATSEPEEEIEQIVTITPQTEPSSPSEATESPSEASSEPPDNLPASVREWATDWSRHTIEFEELFSGGPPRDGIPPIDEVILISQEQATEELNENEPIVAFEHNGEARAYPLAILMWHEIVNDEVAGQPVSITFDRFVNGMSAL